MNSRRSNPSIRQVQEGLKETPGNNDGYIKVRYDGQIDGFEVDTSELEQMESLGLPTAFEFTTNPVKKKRNKKTFRCEICHVTLNSVETMRSHELGVKHLKKEMALKEEREVRIRMGENVKQIPTIIPIPNPEKTKVKVPIRLHQKIEETREPVVGLNYVKEVIAVSDPEMEPHYECDLCGSQGIANGMLGHLRGQKHRKRFFEFEGHNVDLVSGQLSKLTWEHAENMNLAEKIKTKYSDESYPWPPGKAPWSLEKGGTGKSPDGAITNFGMNKYTESLRENARKGLPSPSTLSPPKNSEEKLLTLVGEKYFELAFGYLDYVEKGTLNSIMTAVLSKAKRGITSSDSGGYEEPVRMRNSRSPSPDERRDRAGPSRERYEETGRKRSSGSPSLVRIKRERISPLNDENYSRDERRGQAGPSRERYCDWRIESRDSNME